VAHVERVNRVLDYIAAHLDGDLSLATLARVACFSSFHFHRIFQAVAGETLNSHVRAFRLERATLLLKISPGKRITDAALEAGFAGTAEFSRAFKNHFGQTASSWNRQSPLEKSKIRKDGELISAYPLEELERWRTEATWAVARAPLQRVSLCLHSHVRPLRQPKAGRCLSCAVGVAGPKGRRTIHPRSGSRSRQNRH